MFSPPFFVSTHQFQKASQSSKRPELTEAHQEFSEPSWLASVLHHEFYIGQIWKWTNIRLFSSFEEKA